MPGLLKTHLLRSSVGDLVEGLRFVEPEIIGKTRVLEYLSQIKLSPEAVAPYKQLGSTQ